MQDKRSYLAFDPFLGLSTEEQIVASTRVAGRLASFYTIK